MNKPLYNFFTNDHHRIEGLLNKATEKEGEFEMESYLQFRIGLLTHIKMEEKILFTAAQKANNNLPLPIAARLMAEHGALTSLMVPPPSTGLIKVIRHVLEKHDLAEEEPGGMYDACEALTKNQVNELLQQLSNVTEAPVHPHNTAAYALDSAKRALQRAGYNYDDIVNNV